MENCAAESNSSECRHTQNAGKESQDLFAEFILPPYLLEGIAARNPNIKEYQNTLKMMESGQALFVGNATVETKGNTANGNANGEREVYDAHGQPVHPGDRARFEGEASTGRQEVDDAYDFTGIVRDYYKNNHGRNSIDDQGMKMISTVNYARGLENAFWNGKQMTYGMPGPNSFFETFVLLDVAGHEITHGITEHINHLDYYGQAGALHEHLSDVFGEVIQQKHRNQKASDANWIIGDGIWKNYVKAQGLRNMLHPGTAYNHTSIGRDPQPDHMDNYVKTPTDAGGVHYNSGIPNRAFALFAISMGGNAFDRPAKIWYDASQHLSRTPSFAQFAFETIESSKRLAASSAEIAKLEKAWSEVGIKPSATETDTLTPPKRHGAAVK